MNTGYNRIDKVNSDVLTKLKAAASADISKVPSDIPHGDMPGDKVEIGDIHISKAGTIFRQLTGIMEQTASANPYGRTVIAVCGGSGVGKSEIASVLAFMLRNAGIGTYTLSGDNYPHRIPKYNDAERLHIFREAGMRALADDGVNSAEHNETVRKWQDDQTDADKSHTGTDAWYKSYIDAGSKALAEYLGTPAETDFAEVSSIIKAFKDGADTLALRRMGRDESALWYENVDFSDVKVLIIEWTHGNSDYLEGVDIPVLLNSTPQETLEHRRARGRDGKTDSPFTMLVLELEQEKLKAQAHKAKIILSKSGDLLSFEQYKELMD